jgi:hypothetical protein
MFDDNFHICMIYGIEIKSINQSINLKEFHSVQGRSLLRQATCSFEMSGTTFTATQKTTILRYTVTKTSKSIV